VSRPRAVETGLAFVGVLHDSGFADRARRMRALMAPNATWWLDTGLDRAAGVRGHDPGDARPWPLHGQMCFDAKLELVARVAPDIFPDGVGARISSRAFGTHDLALVEAQGDGLHVSGKRYRNRYAFVFDVSDEGITSIREYLDTLHAEDVFGGDRLSTRSVAPPPAQRPPLEPVSRAEELALALWAPLAAQDVDAFGALFAPGATWWTDSGTDRDAGAFDRVNEPPGTWPLHGVVPMQAKLDAMRARLVEGYGGATLQVTPVRIFGEGPLVALEAEGYCALPNGRVYQNRYVFAIEAHEDGIHQVREYADTLHIVDATGAVPPTS
jgi:ketosteroid isomerase-like protein